MFQWLIYLIQYIKPTVFPHYHYEYLIVLLLLGVSVQVIIKNISVVNFHAFSSLSNLKNELFTSACPLQAYFTKLQFTISVTFSELWCILVCGLRTFFSKATGTCGSKQTLLVLINNTPVPLMAHMQNGDYFMQLSWGLNACAVSSPQPDF